MWKPLQTSLCLLVALICVNGDVYLHNPRGSNNRLNENSKARRNNNRLFDSQNNNNGGYNVGDATSTPAVQNPSKQYQMKYFQSGLPTEQSSTYLTIEWTNQHGCGAGNRNKKVNCNIVLQYMCQPNDKSVDEIDKLRDGVTTQQQIYNKNSKQYESLKAQYDQKKVVDNKRGLHENWEWYDRCAYRKNNEGLYMADQKIKGARSATKTRQNRAGQRSGYECPEERDYYPYWHPTPWIDIAVLSETMRNCKTYASQSFNSKPYEECVELINNGKEVIRHSKWNNKIECEKNNAKWVTFHNFLEKAPQFTDEKSCLNAGKNTEIRYIWGLPSDAKDIPKFECLVAPPKVICLPASYTRVNHLGNSLNGKASTFNWALPYYPSGKDQRCVLRIRYNISTDDYDAQRTDSSHNNKFITNDPIVNFNGVPLQLAINTAQFGRVFQDRSHVFILKPRPNNVKGRIFNLNVRGKRGNIVQAFPAVEYDFVPNKISMKESSDLLHIQWTGSNTNNKNNAGEGKAGTDRNNLLEMKSLGMSYPLPFEDTNLWNNSKVVWIHHGDYSLTSADLSVDVASSGYYNCLKASSCTNSVEKKAKLSEVLNNAPASYEGVLLRIKKGMYYYMCTRNNQFSNRSQKGSLIVK